MHAASTIIYPSASRFLSWDNSTQCSVVVLGERETQQ